VAPVRIGIPPLLSTIFFPDLFIEFNKKYPDIPLELFEYGSIRAAALVNDDVLDLSFVNMHFYDIDKMNSYQITTDSFVFCVSPEHHLANEKEISIGMLENEPLIMYNTDSVQNTTLNALFENIGNKPNIILHASQLYTIKNFVRNNLGGAFLYSSLLDDDSGLVRIPVIPHIEQDIGIVWKKGKYINNSVDKFISFTQKYSHTKFVPKQTETP
ncbi:MAG: LysR family transcriptional regulator substrate-binding protein, partial [Lachnospiraceae bacterium]|nr:LysR family transcriptional regulator substrate-binding protein [Lachnospiraceae bacterium]